MSTSKHRSGVRIADLRDPDTGMFPPLAGGDPTAPTMYPLDPATVSGTLITIDQYVNAPNVITRTIADLSEQKLYANRIFSGGPGVEGGALLFERPNSLLTDLYAARRMQEIAPGTTFPILTFARGVPMVATPRKIGGKFGMTKEDRKRNKVYLVDNAITQGSNTLLRDVEIMALSELNAVIASEARHGSGQSWSDAAEMTFSTKTAAAQPVADLINAQTTVDLEERGHVLNGAVLNPQEYANLVIIYGSDAGVRSMFQSVGITEFYVTPRQAAGKVKLYEAGQVGVWSNEFPLDQTTWFDEDTDNTWWYQWSISPTFAVTDQFALYELTGVA